MSSKTRPIDVFVRVALAGHPGLRSLCCPAPAASSIPPPSASSGQPRNVFLKGLTCPTLDDNAILYPSLLGRKQANPERLDAATLHSLLTNATLAPRNPCANPAAPATAIPPRQDGCTAGTSFRCFRLSHSTRSAMTTPVRGQTEMTPRRDT
ncbi:hypothetical protein C8R44DRAFT_974745 [Mycena epipterygia]|nr:hypothetical protein C8R44DRAFT_974745 [Mycena epipterygia]